MLLATIKRARGRPSLRYITSSSSYRTVPISTTTSSLTMSKELNINHRVPGVDTYYSLNDPPIGTALPVVGTHLCWISAMRA